jgi:hypothetical protein
LEITIMKKIIATIILTCALAVAVYALTGREIMEKSDKLPEPNTIKSTAIMQIFRNGQLKETKEFEMYSKKFGQDTRVLMRFIRPTRIKFLTHGHTGHDDEQWLKTRSGSPKKIASGDSGKPFVHSHFFYEDLKSRNIDDYTYKYLGEGKAVGVDCYKVEGIKKTGSKVYDRTVIFVRKSDHFIVSVNFYKKGKLLKFLKNFNIEKINGILTPRKAVMHLPDGKGKTVITMKSIQYNIPINPALFNKSTL